MLRAHGWCSVFPCCAGLVSTQYGKIRWTILLIFRPSPLTTKSGGIRNSYTHASRQGRVSHCPTFSEDKTMSKFALRVLLCCLVLAAFTFPSSQAQVQEPAENKGAAAAYRALLCLRSTATVLHTTAHPDDEDGAVLTWLSRQQGVRTGLLTLNRGEGGANLIGPELYDALGILRTEELLAAGRYYGVYQMFTRVTDFGFSKRLDETLEHWGREVVLGDVVHAIRMYRPDIIVSRFHGTQRDGHGHHQTAGLMSIEAFKTAADPNRFPEHLQEGLRPWQVKKIYLSVRDSEEYRKFKRPFPPAPPGARP